MWRRIVLLMLIVGVLSTPLSAHASESSGITFSGSLTGMSGYLRNPGIRTDGPVMQSSLTASHESGFYGNLWFSSYLRNPFGTHPSNEIDATVGWAGKLAGTRWTADIGLDFFKFPRLGHFEPTDIVSPHFEVGTPVLAWSGAGDHSTSVFARLELYRTISGANWAQAHLGFRDVWALGQGWGLNTKAFIDFYPNGYLRQGASLVAEVALLYKIPGVGVSLGPWVKGVGVIAGPDGRSAAVIGFQVVVASF